MFEVNVINDVSKRTGRPFTALEIVFPNGYKKLLFLDKAEAFLVNNI